MGSKPHQWNWGGHATHPSAVVHDMYLSTDDEGDGHPFHKKKARNIDKEEAELAQAKEVAHQRMKRHEVMEIERTFAVLDNVREGETFQLKNKRPQQPKCGLNPALNPYIENEAAEAKESDSDLADEESFESATFSVDSDMSTVETEEKFHQCLKSDHSPPLSDHSDTAGQSDSSILYENYCASRELVEAQIQKEQKQTFRYQSSNSSSINTNHHTHSTSSDSASDSGMELEASFSSVFG